MERQNIFVSQLDEISQEFTELLSRSKYDDASDLPEGEVIRFITRARAAIHRIAGKPSIYVDQCEEIVQERGYPGYLAKHLIGVIESLKADVSEGYLQSQQEFIHGELFADFLEMSQHLLNEGYKDAAAVIAGSSLEAHLRQLCVKSGIGTEVVNAKGAISKKADRLNADLAKAQIYSKLDHKNVTAWLDLRNKAAHGHYDQYQAAQVGLLITGIQDFITRNIA